ncbi:hypothetical protein Tco_0900395 [Tanacetum coccineum]
MIVLLLHLIRRRRRRMEEERINHLKQDQGNLPNLPIIIKYSAIGTRKYSGRGNLIDGKSISSESNGLIMQPVEGHLRCSQAKGSNVEERLVHERMKMGVFDGAFGGVGDEEVVVGEGVVVTSSSLEMLTNSYLGGIKVNLIFLERFEEEAFVEFMVDFG